MKSHSVRALHMLVLGGLPALSQGVAGVDLQALRSAAGGTVALGSADAVPRAAALPTPEPTANPNRRAEEERLNREIRAMKRAEKGPRRFAADLFEVRQLGAAATEGGVAEDYVLGVGDRLQLNVFGSATFELPIQVDGKGEVVIPKVGTAKVAGRTLAQAKAVVQGLVARNFSRSTAELQVLKLREIRVFVMGEVYKPGSYLVSSLSSLVNVLGLAGGPTAVGSYRDIRVMRGGQKVFSLDLYPLRAEGLGNPNFALQSGDTIFVPLATAPVILEGAFTRVALQTERIDAESGGNEGDPDLPQTPADLDPKRRSGEFSRRDEGGRKDGLEDYRDRIKREMATIEAMLKAPVSLNGLPTVAAPGDSRTQEGGLPAWANLSPVWSRSTPPQTGTTPDPNAKDGGLGLRERRLLEERLLGLKRQLADLAPAKPGDHRLPLDPRSREPLPEPEQEVRAPWIQKWEKEGRPPVMAFEMKPGETVADALRFAGGLVPEAGEGVLTVRSRTPSGIQEARTVALRDEASVVLRRGDVVSAPLAREAERRAVTLAGWVRLPGAYARTEGLRVADLLKQQGQVLPDTYLLRGELVRTSLDGTTRFLSFDLQKALAGDPAHNLLLEDRDRIECFRIGELRLQKTVRISGPVAREGYYTWHEGLRASDLIFRAGVPAKSANRLVGELAHTRDGKPAEIRRLDLGKLISDEKYSPVALQDDVLNPKIEVDDHLSLFEKPEYKPLRTVRLSGQVARPGQYTLEGPHTSLKEILTRAGGLTEEAMANAGVFLRRLDKGDPSLQRAAEESGLQGNDPTAKGINEILERLNETKRQPSTGQLLSSPLLHGLLAGNFNRLVVDFEGAIKGRDTSDVELQDGDEIIIPRRTQAAYVVGETASPFGAYKIGRNLSVKDLLRLAGGTTRNADTWNIRLLKSDGRIIDSWVGYRRVEPGDTVLVPQRIRRDTSWQENLNALTPIALILNAVRPANGW